ncbi:uncharacterized protein LOC102809338, partial [Saccoglossus kowalevskii]|uniref:Zinc finger protein Aiolos-like n=1 Tax=Saccoglossus kowalevskii TaxID=10224 RepID=A0ABM0MFH3_SACKO
DRASDGIYVKEEQISENESKKESIHRDFRCDQCEYSAVSATQLSQHQRCHTGDRPYICDICGFAFTQKGNLTRHYKTHTNEKPFKCSVCPYEARRRDALLAHMVTHTEDKRYVCELCSTGYKQKASLREHMKKCGHSSMTYHKGLALFDKEHKKRKSSTPMRNPGV